MVSFHRWIRERRSARRRARTRARQGRARHDSAPRRIDLDGKRQRGNRAQARDGDQTLADLAGLVRGSQLGIDVFDTGVDFVDLLTQKDEHFLRLRRYGGLLFNSKEQRHDFSDSVRGPNNEKRHRLPGR